MNTERKRCWTLRQEHYMLDQMFYGVLSVFLGKVDNTGNSESKIPWKHLKENPLSGGLASLNQAWNKRGSALDFDCPRVEYCYFCSYPHHSQTCVVLFWWFRAVQALALEHNCGCCCGGLWPLLLCLLFHEWRRLPYLVLLYEKARGTIHQRPKSWAWRQLEGKVMVHCRRKPRV